MKIGLLVCVDDEIEKTQMFGVHYMPVWAYTLASYLRELNDIEIFLYDTRCFSKDKTPYADIFLISGINQDFNALIEYQNLLRKIHPNSRQILGGPIVSSYILIGKINLLYGFDHLYSGDAEDGIKKIIQDLIENKKLDKVIVNNSKFYLSKARPIDFQLLKDNKDFYYGGVLEVSRGCPFLCEFCDIRTKIDNNISNNKPIEIIIKELDQYAAIGIKNILMACDNFIGDHVWAEKLCDQIIEWKKDKKINLNIYTWLTLNLAYFPRLMEKMKLAGFDMLFIGVESFGVEQLLETAKVQNIKTDISTSIKTIQSHGFIIVAGLIFGFDTDKENVVQVALNGILESGIISGDPSLLTALPGTPLFTRMKKSGRLRDGKIGLGGKKYATNILYLRNKNIMINDFIYFTQQFNKAPYQFKRYNNFLNSLKSFQYINTSESGYIDIRQLWKMVKKHPDAIFSFIKRILGVFSSPQKIYYVLRALIKTMQNPNAKMSFFYFWLFNWSNSILKYGNLQPHDFDIDSVDELYNLKDIIPKDYLTDYFEPIPKGKIKSQRMATFSALSKLIANEK